jgi:hypothetical protein
MLTSHLLAEAYNDIFCKIAPSPIHGVGVFAIKEIPPNTVIFRRSIEWEDLDKKFLDRIDSNVALLYRELLLDTKDNIKIRVPTKGFSSLDISFYVNHSIIPTAKYDIDNNFIVSSTKINIGDEITFNYKVFGHAGIF